VLTVVRAVGELGDAVVVERLPSKIARARGEQISTFDPHRRYGPTLS
jgi:hypothetical protein